MELKIFIGIIYNQLHNDKPLISSNEKHPIEKKSSVERIVFDGNPDNIEAFHQLQKLAEEFIKLELEEIKKGRAKSIVDSVQKLQQLCFKKKLFFKESVTKVTESNFSSHS